MKRTRHMETEQAPPTGAELAACRALDKLTEAEEELAKAKTEIGRLQSLLGYRAGEIRLNKAGTLDEVVASDLDFFHMEQMDEGSWWLSLTLRGGGNITIWLNTKRPSRTKILARAERS